MANVSSSNGLEKRPKLRFPGFDEPLVKFEIGNACEQLKETIDPRTTPTKFYAEYSMPAFDNNRKVARVQGKDMNSARKIMSKPCVLINKLNVRKKRIWLVEHPEKNAVSSTEFVPLTSTMMSLGYLNYVALTDRFTNYMLNCSSGSSNSQKRVTPDDIMDYVITVPSLLEQVRVASFLETIDSKIQAQQDLIELLKKYKRGLQNRFFFKRSQQSKKSSEISSHEVKPLGSIVQINPKTGLLPEAFIYIDLECVEAGVLHSRKLISRNSAPSRAQRVLREGDLIYQMVRPYQKNNYYFQKAFEYPTVASTGYAQIRCSEANTQFIYEQLSSDYFAREAMLRSTGTGYPAINADDLAEIPIWVPPFERQQKVGAVLSFIGAKIEANQRMLSALCRVKSSLLQQLFI